MHKKTVTYVHKFLYRDSMGKTKLYICIAYIEIKKKNDQQQKVLRRINRLLSFDTTRTTREHPYGVVT
jgi:hypothetical protein